MRPQMIVLAALATLSLVTTAFAGAGAAAAPPKTPAVTSATAHTPMTPAQTQALWQAAQTKLKADHLYNGPINGERTDQTMAAIRTFQSLHQLPQSGHLDQSTRQALGI